MLQSNSVLATSYPMLDPEEVDDRAGVVVLGRYDFSTKVAASNHVVIGFRFDVEGVYRGYITEPLVVGIDMYDMKWVDEWQKDGGKLLLFLEKSDGEDYWVPVLLQNGMISMRDGQVVLHDERKVYYNNFLATHTKRELPSNVDFSKSHMYLSTIVFVIWIAAIAIYRSAKRKSVIQ